MFYTTGLLLSTFLLFFISTLIIYTVVIVLDVQQDMSDESLGLSELSNQILGSQGRMLFNIGLFTL